MNQEARERTTSAPLRRRLVRGQRTQRARPDDLEAQEMKTAIELRAARTGSDSPRKSTSPICIASWPSR